MIRVLRESYYRTEEGGSLRYSEEAPEHDRHEGVECGCTKNTSVRPAGEPTDFRQTITIEGKARDLPYDLKLGRNMGGPWLTFRWEGPEEGWTYQKHREAHAYFIFDRNNIRNSLGIQMTLPGYGLVDCFFGNVYFGNNVDTGKFMNGHSPSGIVNLDKIGEDQVWVHGCRGGDEAMEILRECEETERLRTIKRTIDEVRLFAASRAADQKSSVEDIRLDMEASIVIKERAKWATGWMAEIVENLTETELYRKCDSVYRQTTPDTRRTRKR